MSRSNRPVSHRDLGVSRDGIGVEADLNGIGELVMEATPFEGGRATRLVLDKDQALALVAWLANRREIANAD